MKNSSFDLLTTVEYGGCSAKLPAKQLTELLSSIPLLKNENILVDIETHDDAGVYKLNETTALIVTTDFFPPVCSDPYTFGEIAAANSLSDIYAMGGKPLLTLNINMFPSKTIPLDVLRDILAGGQNKVNESGAFTMGGHTIEDNPPKYGLAVVGIVDPNRVITNSGAKVGQKLILTKPIGSGVLSAAQRMKLANEESYQESINQMKILNNFAADVMQKHDVKGATDITGFGLAGHVTKMATASGVTMSINCSSVPLLDQVKELIEEGCIPGAAFRNLEFIENDIKCDDNLSVDLKMAMCDAQTSGGILMAIDSDKADIALVELKKYYPYSAIIGDVLEKQDSATVLSN